MTTFRSFFITIAILNGAMPAMAMHSNIASKASRFASYRQQIRKHSTDQKPNDSWSVKKDVQEDHNIVKMVAVVKAGIGAWAGLMGGAVLYRCIDSQAEDAHRYRTMQRQREILPLCVTIAVSSTLSGAYYGTNPKFMYGVSLPPSGRLAAAVVGSTPILYSYYNKVRERYY